MKSILSIAAMMMATSVAANPFEVLVPIKWSVEPQETQVAELRRMHDEFGLRKFVIIGPWNKRYFCEADVAAYAKTGRDIAYAKKALSDLKDVEIGWWLAPSIGSSRDFPGQRMIDWCFAGLVTAGRSVLESRHYAAMAVDGEDLVLVSRSGDEQAHNPHNTDMVTFHRIRDFRSLVY